MHLLTLAAATPVMQFLAFHFPGKTANEFKLTYPTNLSEVCFHSVQNSISAYNGYAKLVAVDKVDDTVYDYLVVEDELQGIYQRAPASDESISGFFWCVDPGQYADFGTFKRQSLKFGTKSVKLDKSVDIDFPVVISEISYEPAGLESGSTTCQTDDCALSRLEGGHGALGIYRPSYTVSDTINFLQYPSKPDVYTAYLNYGVLKRGDSKLKNRSRGDLVYFNVLIGDLSLIKNGLFTADSMVNQQDFETEYIQPPIIQNFMVGATADHKPLLDDHFVPIQSAIVAGHQLFNTLGIAARGVGSSLSGDPYASFGVVHIVKRLLVP